MREYRFRRPDNDWSQSVGLEQLVDVTKERVEPGFKPYYVIQDGEKITGDLLYPDAILKFKRAISNREIGSVFRLRDTRDVQFTARAVEILSDANTTSGNRKADIFYNWVRSEYGIYEPRFAGSYVCKDNSQHRYGNAVDFFFDTLNHQEEVANAAVAQALELSLYHAISKQRIWTKGVGWHPHTGEYHGHLHADFDPNFSTSIACGVR
jgi:hypothetical protein